MKKLKKLGLLLLFVAVAGFATYLISQAVQGRKLTQMIADDENCWDVFTDVGVTATPAELNLTNQGTDVVSDTFYHTMYVSVPLNFAVRNTTQEVVFFTKPTDVAVTVIGVTISVDSGAVCADGTDQVFAYLFNYDVSADTLDSLIVTNALQLDTVNSVTYYRTIQTTTSNNVMSDGDYLVVQISMTNTGALTTQARAVATVELYVKPE